MSSRSFDDFQREKRAAEASGDTSHIVDAPPNQHEEQIFHRGQDALRDLHSDMTWNKWMAVGEALDAGRTYCKRIARANDFKGRGYVEAFSRWLHRYEFSKLDQAARKRLFDCMDNRSQIEDWRKTLSPGEITRYNHPTTVWRKWQASSKVHDPDAPPKASPYAKQQESIRKQDEEIAELKKENARLKDEIGDGGDAWKASDRSQDIADAFADKCFRGGMGPSKFDELLKKAKLAFDARHAYAAKKEKGKNKPTHRKGGPGPRDIPVTVGAKPANDEQAPLQWEPDGSDPALDDTNKEYPRATAQAGSGRYSVSASFDALGNMKFAGYSVLHIPDSKHPSKNHRYLDGNFRTIDEGKAAAERDWSTKP